MAKQLKNTPKNKNHGHCITVLILEQWCFGTYCCEGGECSGIQIQHWELFFSFPFAFFKPTGSTVHLNPSMFQIIDFFSVFKPPPIYYWVFFSPICFLLVVVVVEWREVGGYIKCQYSILPCRICSMHV